jgi:hypothetical protein
MNGLRRLVLVGLIVLGVASSAWAECESPWVAWIIRTDSPDRSVVFEAFVTKAECDEKVKGRERPGPEGTLGAAIFMRCYPAAVDPRPRSGR